MTWKLRDTVSLADDEILRAWGVATALDCADLSDLEGARRQALSNAVRSAGERLHPTAEISPHAVVADDVIVGPNCQIHEFSTVRGGTILGAGVEIGHGCEITRSVVASRARLAHRVVLADAIVGRRTHLAAAVIVGSVHLWNVDMARPDRQIVVQLDSGASYACGQVKFGGVFGDRVRVGMGALLGPGLIVGADAVLYPGLTVSEQIIPARSVARPTPVTVRLEPRRDRPAGDRAGAVAVCPPIPGTS
jgi:NDP-sugar pyrophosphorylase family protein